MRMFRCVRLAVVFFAAAAAGLPATAHSETQAESRNDQASFFLILSADSFLCMPCFERIIAFARVLPVGSSQAGLWAVVLYDPPETGADEESYRVMIARRAESVLRAHGLLCPIVLDEARKWQGLSSEGAGLLILDGRTRSVRAFPLPLAPEALIVIQEILKGDGYHE